MLIYGVKLGCYHLISIMLHYLFLKQLIILLFLFLISLNYVKDLFI